MRLIKKGATSQSLYVEILDSTSTTGGRKTGLVFNTSGLTAYYARNGAASVAITLATLAAASSAWATGGFKEVDATNMPGLYRIDVPDLAFASGAESVVVTVRGATGAAQVSEEVQLTALDLQDGVRAGLTALPNAAASAIGGLPLAVDTSGRVDVLKVNGTSQTAKDLGASATQTGDSYARLGAPAGASTAADIAAVKSDTGTTLTDVNTGAGAIYTRLGAPAGASIAADIAAVKSDSGTTLANAAAIKTQTDKLTFTHAGALDANVHYVNDVKVNGNGQAGTEWGP